MNQENQMLKVGSKEYKEFYAQIAQQLIKGWEMKSHAVKEQISNNTLYVEIEPQPDWIDLMNFSGYQSPKIYTGTDKWVGVTNNDEEPRQERTPPISIGDIVYRGEEWLQSKDGLFNYSFDNAPQDRSYLSQQLPETMPIELVDKTFKVVGIEVQQFYPTNPIWFWSYKLEEIK